MDNKQTIKKEKLKTIIDKFILNDFIFAVLMLLMTFATSIPYVDYHIKSYYKFILLYGILVSAWLLVTGKLLPQLKNNKANLFLIGFLLSYLITIFLNKDAFLVDNLKQYAYMVIFAVLLVFAQQYKTQAQLTKQIKAISALILTITFILSNICYKMYQDGFFYDYKIENDYEIIGSYNGTLYGLYNPNTCGALCAISIIISLGFIYCALKKKSEYMPQLVKKVLVIGFNLYNIVIEYLCLVPTGSRASTYALYLATAFALLLIIVRVIIEHRTKGNAKPASVVAMSQFMYIEHASSGTFNRVVVFLQNAIGGLSGRDAIWTHVWNAFLENPILGLTNLKARDVVIKAFEEVGDVDSALTVTGGGFHNIYLTVLSSSGVLGFVFIGIAVLVLLITTIVRIIKNKESSATAIFACTMTVFFLFVEFFESRIIYSVDIFAIIFWICLGYLSSTKEKLK